MTAGSYLCIVLPKHPQEVEYRVRQRTLSGDVGPGTRHSLESMVLTFNLDKAHDGPNTVMCRFYIHVP